MEQAEDLLEAGYLKWSVFTGDEMVEERAYGAHVPVSEVKPVNCSRLMVDMALALYTETGVRSR